MLESLIGPDMMKKIVSKLASLVCVILAFIGLMMVMMTAFVAMTDKTDPWTPRTYIVIFHAHFWPMLVAFAFASANLVVSKGIVKKVLVFVVFGASLWVMLNAIMGWIQAPSSEGMGELIGPLMMPIQAVGGFMGVLAGLVGIAGVIKK